MSEPITGNPAARAGTRAGDHAVSSAELRLLAVALIWGFDFVAQRQGVLASSAFFFNAASFFLGASVHAVRHHWTKSVDRPPPSGRLPGIVTGVVLFAAMSFQTSGMATTGAGKSAFITSLYLVLVPMVGALSGERIRSTVLVGGLVALAGIYLLCVPQNLECTPGDLLVLSSAAFWTAHIVLVGRFAADVSQTGFAQWQFLTCGFLSLVATIAFESVSVAQIRDSLWPIFFNGFLSAGLAYSLQISGQSGVSSSRAAILLSLETLFAAIGGFLILHERFDTRGIAGGALMVAGTLISRLRTPSAASDPLIE